MERLSKNCSSSASEQRRLQAEYDCRTEQAAFDECMVTLDAMKADVLLFLQQCTDAFTARCSVAGAVCSFEQNATDIEECVQYLEETVGASNLE